MQGEIVRIYESNNKGDFAGKVRTANGMSYNIYQLPTDIRVKDRVEFNIRRSQTGNDYAVFEELVENYFEIYGGNIELGAIYEWIDTIAGMRNRVRDVVEDNQAGHDYIIYYDDGSQTLVEVKNEENYWYEITGNITIDAISAFTVESTEVRDYINKNRNWIEIEDYQRFLDGINIKRRGTLYESDADILVKRIIGGNFVKAYNMQNLKQNASFFEQNYRLRVNDKKGYGIEEN